MYIFTRVIKLRTSNLAQLSGLAGTISAMSLLKLEWNQVTFCKLAHSSPQSCELMHHFTRIQFLELFISMHLMTVSATVTLRSVRHT